MQTKESSTQMTIFAVDENLSSKGCLKESKHWMKLAKEKLISQGEQSAEFDKVPLPEFVAYFCNHCESKVPPVVSERGNLWDTGI